MRETKDLKEIRVILTKKELAYYNTLTDEMKEIYKNQKYKEKQDLLVKSCVMTTILIETLDKMKDAGLIVGNLKKTALPFNLQTNLYLTRVFNVNKDPSKSNDYLAEVIKYIDNAWLEIDKSINR